MHTQGYSTKKPKRRRPPPQPATPPPPPKVSHAATRHTTPFHSTCANDLLGRAGARPVEPFGWDGAAPPPPGTRHTRWRQARRALWLGRCSASAAGHPTHAQAAAAPTPMHAMSWQLVAGGAAASQRTTTPPAPMHAMSWQLAGDKSAQAAAAPTPMHAMSWQFVGAVLLLARAYCVGAALVMQSILYRYNLI